MTQTRPDARTLGVGASPDRPHSESSLGLPAWDHEDAEATLRRLRERLDRVDLGSDAPSARGERGDGELDGALYDAGPLGGPSLEPDPAPAAVLAPLVVRGDALHLVFTLRAAHLKRHAGQVSFPGGRRDPDDASLLATALREAHEEIGLTADRVQIIGRFEPYRTGTGYAVTPFVGLIDPTFAPQPALDEVAEVFEAPFKFLMNPANHAVRSVEWRGAQRRFYEMPFENRYIWGATAGMLRVLHERLYE